MMNFSVPPCIGHMESLASVPRADFSALFAEEVLEVSKFHFGLWRHDTLNAPPPGSANDNSCLFRTSRALWKCSSLGSGSSLKGSKQ